MTDDSKQSMNDSLTIDNQADYNQIFRPKARLSRSPSQQSVPSSSSSGFTVEGPPSLLKSSKPPSQVRCVQIVQSFNEKSDVLQIELTIPSPPAATSAADSVKTHIFASHLITDRTSASRPERMNKSLPIFPKLIRQLVHCSNNVYEI